MGRAGEKRLVQLASKQFGVVTAKDIAACEVSSSLLCHRLETGEWIRLHRGVYQLGSNKPNIDGLEMAAMLAAGNGAVLSHSSAAGRLGLDVPRNQSVQITIPASRRRPRLAGVQVWWSRNLIASDVTKRGPLRMTQLARTIIDLASVLDEAWLQAMLDSALRQSGTNLAWISRALKKRGQGHRGARRLQALVAEYRSGDEVPDSVLESFANKLGRATGHEPKLHWNVLEGGRRVAEVDLAWPEVRLCVELDGWTWHRSRTAFVGDRARDRALVGLGWAVLRYAWQDVTGDPDSVIAELVGIYESRASASTRSPKHRKVNGRLSR